MADGKISPIEFHLLKTQCEIQGELIARERVERQAEVDRLKVELEALRNALTLLVPDFAVRYQESYSEGLQNYNPEAGKKVS